MPKFIAGLVAGALVLCAGYALASRNSSGTMSAANGPYQPGTTISSSIINSRFADIEAEITDSLSRSGKGGMSAALKGSDGTVAAPAFSWTSEPGTGWYRIGAGNPGLSVLGAKRLECTSTGCVVTGTLGVSGGTTLTGAAVLSSTLNVAGVATLASANIGNQPGATELLSLNSASGAGMQFLKTSVAEYKIGLCNADNKLYIHNTSGNVALCGNSAGLTVDTSGNVAAPVSLKIGSSGTAISGSFAASSTASPAAISANSCAVMAVLSTTGSVAGSPCAMGTTENHTGQLHFWCIAGAPGLCSVIGCNLTAGAITPTAGSSYSCRVFNP